jgi:hypothetical protein
MQKLNIFNLKKASAFHNQKIPQIIVPITSLTRAHHLKRIFKKSSFHTVYYPRFPELANPLLSLPHQIPFSPHCSLCSINGLVGFWQRKKSIIAFSRQIFAFLTIRLYSYMASLTFSGGLRSCRRPKRLSLLVVIASTNRIRLVWTLGAISSCGLFQPMGDWTVCERVSRWEDCGKVEEIENVCFLGFRNPKTVDFGSWKF